jgi:predicted ATPase
MAENQKERLIVRNFGPISNLDIEIRPLTLFIGTQGSGKSTISKLLTICRDLRWWLLLLENAESEKIMKPFYDFAINEFFQEDSYIYYTVNGGIVRYEHGIFSFKSEVVDADIIKEYISYSNTKLMHNSLVPISETEDKLSNNIMDANARMILYILAERNLVGNLSESLASMLTAQVPLPKPMMEYMSMFERAKKEYPTYNIPFFGVKFIKKEGRERIELQGKNKDLPLSACSSGLQSAIPMLMVIDYALKMECFDAFVIEEPEQNLFPENQFEVLGFITSKFWVKEQCQFVITTHSPYMLSSLNVLMLAYRLHQNEDVREQVDEIVKPGFTVNPDNVSVYSLYPDGEEYCKSLISEKTGLVSVNELDSVSEIIGDDFERLYSLYLQTKKKK